MYNDQIKPFWVWVWVKWNIFKKHIEIYRSCLKFVKVTENVFFFLQSYSYVQPNHIFYNNQFYFWEIYPTYLAALELVGRIIQEMDFRWNIFKCLASSGHMVKTIVIAIPWVNQYDMQLKLPSLFAAWLFRTFHTKSHNMKALVILSHSWSPCLPLTCLYRKQWTFVSLCVAFWSIFLRKNSPQISHANHMAMTTSGQS